MDGNYIQLLRFQLNSITSLWKAEDSMLPYNLAWYSPRVELCKLQSDLEYVFIVIVSYCCYRYFIQ